jgi:hypothetical protein
MRISSAQSKFWLFVSLFALLLAACSSVVGEEETDQAQSGTAVAEASNNSGDSSSTGDAVASEETAGTATPTAEAENPTATVDVSESNSANEDQEADELAESDQPAIPEPATEEATDVETSDPEPIDNIVPDDGVLTVDDRTDLLRQVTAEWNTDWKRHTVPYSEIVPVLFRDGIRSLDTATFETSGEALEWLPKEDPVIVVEIDGEARAYPLRILTTHEIVNDTFGETPIVITYCPLCNSALVFDRRFGDDVFEFGTSGLLRNSDLIMYDRTSETLWQQFTGEGIVGEHAGEMLTFLGSSIVSFDDFRQAFEEGMVLSRNTGFPFDYSLSSYQDYDQIGQEPFLFIDYDGEAQIKDIDRRLPVMERVVSVSLDGFDIAYPVSLLSDVGVISDNQEGQDLVVFHTFGTTSAFYNTFAQRFDDVGATGVFDPNLDGQLLTFSKAGDNFVDAETGSVWNIFGQAVEGPLSGEKLAPIVHGDHFWFSWAAFKPDTLIYEG